jgi:hypothetical protein
MADTLLRAALRMAEVMGGARLSVLAVRQPNEVSLFAGGALSAESESVVRARQPEQQRVSALHSIFNKWVENTGADARWSETEGVALANIGERGSRADVIIAGQPEPVSRCKGRGPSKRTPRGPEYRSGTVAARAVHAADRAQPIPTASQLMLTAPFIE